MAQMVGGIEFNIITDLTKVPQKVASAMSEIESNEMVGASYKPLIYLGTQPVRGTNYWFIAEETLITANLDKHVVTIAVNEFGDEFEIVKSSIVKII